MEKLLERDSFACHAMVAQFLFFLATSLWVLRAFDRREASAYGSDTYIYIGKIAVSLER